MGACSSVTIVWKKKHLVKENFLFLFAVVVVVVVVAVVVAVAMRTCVCVDEDRTVMKHGWIICLDHLPGSSTRDPNSFFTYYYKWFSCRIYNLGYRSARCAAAASGCNNFEKLFSLHFF